MKKKILSAVLAVCLSFGSAAVLPQSTMAESTSIVASAAEATKKSGNYEYKILKDGTASITKYTGKESKVTIPSTLGGKKVSTIGQNAFLFCSSVTSVTIPESVTEIGYSAFLQCPKLTTVNLSKNTEKISAYAFAKTKLTSISIPYSTSIIGTSAFEDCKSLTSVYIGGGRTKTIENYAFKGCTALSSLHFGSVVSVIGSYAFKDCISLKTLTIPDSVTGIYQRAFEGCTSLTSAVIGNNVKTIGNAAFINCSKLKDVTFGVSVEKIGDNAFEDCSSLSKVELMPSTKELGTGAFGGCSAITYAFLPDVEVIGPKAFMHCAKLNEVYLSNDKAIKIGELAFVSCPNLLKIGIPEKVNSLGDYCFGFAKAKEKYNNVLICGVSNSAAEKYAKKYGFKFQSTAKHTEVNKTVTVPSTCKTSGYQITLCKYCGKTTRSNTKAANGHSWDQWSTTKNPTCTAEGEQVRYCKLCGEKTHQTVKALGHSYTDWTTTSFNVDKGTSTQTRKCSRCGKADTKTVSNAVTRFAGANRYDTAAKLSKSSYRTADTVIIADAMTFQDALIAVPLASAYNAPLLLANPNTITTQTEAELKRLKAKKVIIVNTNGALKKPTLDALKKYNPTIISGKNCFETSKKVAEALQAKIKTNTKNKTTAPTDVFFTTNKAFADALSVSPVAALKGAPILYVDPSKKTLDSNITAYLNKVKGSVKNVYIVGGTTAIPKALENSIKSALPKKNYKRFDGATRYETCVMINQYFAGVLSSKTVCVAKGLDFPDALAGGVFAAKQKAPLLLADNALKDAHKNYLKKKAIDKLYIFGGTVAVPDKLAKEVAKASV